MIDQSLLQFFVDVNQYPWQKNPGLIPEIFYTNLIKYYNDFKISYKVSSKRQEMVNSWPLDLDCKRAIKEWNWKPQYNLETAFNDYLIPQIKKQYNIKGL